MGTPVLLPVILIALFVCDYLMWSTLKTVHAIRYVNNTEASDIQREEMKDAIRQETFKDVLVLAFGSRNKRIRWTSGIEDDGGTGQTKLMIRALCSSPIKITSPFRKSV